MDTNRVVEKKGGEGLGILGLLVGRPVAANLIVLSMVLVGFLSLWNMKREVFPGIDLDIVQITIPVVGASASEIETGVLQGTEAALRSVRGVRRIASEARREVGLVRVELERGVDARQALMDVKSAVDEVRNLPANAETPVVRLLRADDLIFSILLYGEGTQMDVFKAAEALRMGLLREAGLSRVEHAYEREREITIEVDSLEMEALGLSLMGVAGVVAENSLDQLGGYLAGDSEESSVRMKARMYTPDEYEAIVVENEMSGGVIVLDEIASVRETFGSSRTRSLYEGKAAALLHVYREGNERPGDLSHAFKRYAEEHDFPEGIAYRIVDDKTVEFSSRVGLLLNNAWMGLILVWVTLSLFLKQRIAFRVMVGIPVCFIGACLPIYFLGGSVNMISLAAFIVTLGIVVDDAIIIGEGIYEKQTKGFGGRESVYATLRELGGPVIAAVLTNIIAFLPLFFLPGFLGKILYQIPVVVVSVLILSLIESVFILPSHLVKKSLKVASPSRITGIQKMVTGQLGRFGASTFRSWIEWLFANRYLALSGVAVWLLLCLGLLTSGLVRTSLTPRLEGDTVLALARLEAGATLEDAERIREELTRTWEATVASLELKDAEVLGVWSLVSDRDLDDDTNSGGRLAVEVRAFLGPSEGRSFGTEALANAWGKATKGLWRTDFVGFSGTSDVGAEPILIELRHSDFEVAKEAARILKVRLQAYNVASSIDLGGTLEMASYDLSLNEKGEMLGLTKEDLMDAARGALHGVEAMRYQDGAEEVRVMVREPVRAIRDLASLLQVRVALPSGGFVSLEEVGAFERGVALEQIVRADGGRVVPVAIELKAGVDEDSFAGKLEGELLPELQKVYPKLGYSFQGEQKEDGETFASMSLGLGLAMVGIYALLAISLNSYTLPLVIILVVPLGIGGAILGHLLMGIPFSLVSFVGVLALSGIVVNDALVLVHAGLSLSAGGRFSVTDLRRAAQMRLRPILLTSFTTFAGLMPLLFESSPQAQFLVPLAVSLGFGVLFATVTTLILVPSLLLVRQDLIGLLLGPQPVAETKISIVD